MTRYSSSRGRRLRFDEALLERALMTRVGSLFAALIPARLDKILIPISHGRLSCMGRDVVGLLTTTGAKSGRSRTQPVTLLQDGHTMIAVGSNYGRDQHPSWSANLLAHPECTVEFMGPPAPFRAEMLTGEERDTAWAIAVDFYAGYESYRSRCAPRKIRLFRLSPAT